MTMSNHGCQVIKETVMKRYNLSEFAKKLGQSKAAEKLGIYQSAVSKAIRTGRKITVLVYDDGRVEAEEIKPFPNQRHQTDFAA